MTDWLTVQPVDTHVNPCPLYDQTSLIQTVGVWKVSETDVKENVRNNEVSVLKVHVIIYVKSTPLFKQIKY